jgi:hypothetical protein
MPCVGRVNGIDFYLYADDHNPPHVHVFYAEHEVLLVIATGTIYAGSMPRPQLADALGWLQMNRQKVTAEWNRLNP